MKPTEFFKEKATAYLGELNQLIPNFIGFLDRYPKEEYDQLAFEQQQKQIKYLILKIRILLSEFDNKLFIEHVDKEPKIDLYFSTEGLEFYKNTLDIFIDSLELYRS